MELPFAVESPERSSQLLPTLPTGGDGIADDGSLVTASSQGSFLTTSTGIPSVAATPTIDRRQQHPPTHIPLAATSPMAVPSHSNPNARQQQSAHYIPQQQQQHAPPNVIQATHQPTLVSPSRATHMVAPPLPTTAPRPPSTPMTTTAASSGGGITSGLNFFGNMRVFGSSPKKPQHHQHHPQHVDTPNNKASLETIDFTYVNVTETDADEVDITLSGQLTAIDGPLSIETEDLEAKRGDILALLLSGAVQQEERLDGDSPNESLVRQCEEANHAASAAAEAKREGDLQGALAAHAQAAKQFHEAALLLKDRNMPMANSLLLLSQTQAKSALALKRIIRQSPLPHDNNPAEGKNPRSKMLTQKDRLRAAVRGALVTRNEEEMSASAFLGKATKGPMGSSSNQGLDTSNRASDASQNSAAGSSTSASSAQHNPVDDMMELERQLKDMDLALELGNSIASLDARTQTRLKSSTIGVDGSFMVVPGSQSYMSSSNMWAAVPSSGSATTGTGRGNSKATSSRATATAGTAGVRARANRVQNILGASTNHPRSPHHQQQGLQPHQQQQNTAKNVVSAPPPSGLESSWWGTSSTTSQVLTSSVISLGASSIRPGPSHESHSADPGSSPANTKQLMRLMDALKTLGDENANLLREVEEAEAARMEAKAAKEQMAKFKQEYSKRFEHLKAALKKFRESNPEGGSGGGESNLVTNSDYMRSASTTEQIQRQEQLIRKLTADLKKEKEESHKKDMALQKYENFYREVKARSAAKQRQRESGAAAAQRPPPPKSAGARRTGQR